MTRKVNKPVILSFGSKEQINKDFENCIDRAKQAGKYAKIDLKEDVFQEDRKTYYHFLHAIAKQLGEMTEDIEFQWEVAIEDTDKRIRADFPNSKTNFKEKSLVLYWIDLFASYGTLYFVEWLKKFHRKTDISILIKNSHSIPYTLQIPFERYFIPTVSKSDNVTVYVFHQGCETPTWKTYFEKYVHSISRVDPKLAHMKNPYIAGRPIPADKSGIFFGRETEIEKMKELIQGDRECVMVLSAEKRMGKTSLLKKLANDVKNTHIPVFLDSSAFDKPQNKEDGDSVFLWKMLFDLCYQLRESIQTDLREPQYSDFRFQPKHVFSHFIKERIFPILDSQKILFIFDEFDLFDQWIAEGFVNSGLFDFLRNTLVHSDRTAFIFAGTERLKELSKTYHTNIFGNVRFFEIGLLKREAAENLIRKPLKDIVKFEPEAVEKLLLWTGCHPYLTQLLCSEISERIKKMSIREIKEADVDNEAHTVNMLEGYFSYLWNKSSESEKHVLAEIANSTSNFNEHCSDTSFGSNRLENADVCNLMQRGILRFESFLRFQTGLYYEWIKKRDGMELQL